MRTTARIPLAFTLCCMVGVACAAPTQIVQVADREWYQPKLFTQLSWNEIDAVCPASTGGLCGAGSLNGVSVQGWTWANTADANQLVYALTGLSAFNQPSPASAFVDNSTWAPYIMNEVFGPTATAFGNRSVIGWLRTANDVNARDLIFAERSNGINGPASDFVSTVGVFSRTTSEFFRGAFLYRETRVNTVPEAPSLALAGLALALAAFGRRRRPG
jgi:MYXO-CTERM domain-containing protein